MNNPSQKRDDAVAQASRHADKIAPKPFTDPFYASGMILMMVPSLLAVAEVAFGGLRIVVTPLFWLIVAASSLAVFAVLEFQLKRNTRVRERELKRLLSEL